MLRKLSRSIPYLLFVLTIFSFQTPLFAQTLGEENSVKEDLSDGTTPQADVAPLEDSRDVPISNVEVADSPRSPHLDEILPESIRKELCARCSCFCDEGETPPKQSNSGRTVDWLKAFSIEMTFGGGYLFNSTIKIDDGNTERYFIPAMLSGLLSSPDPASGFTIANLSADLMVHYPIFDYYSIGAGFSSNYFSMLFVSIDNRFRLPVSEDSALFVDVPVGLNLLNFSADEPIIDIGARIGAIVMSKGHSGFIIHLGPDFQLVKQEGVWNNLSSVRLGLGFFIAI